MNEVEILGATIELEETHKTNKWLVFFDLLFLNQ